MNPRSPRIKSAAAAQKIRAAWNALTGGLSRCISHDSVAVSSRLAIAAIFYRSGRTKVEGFLSVTDSAVELFRTEFKLPLIAPEIAAHLATYAEHVFPLLLVLGLCTRLSALALLVMTLTIQIFVYPDAWPTHLSWAALLLYLAGRGGGKLALDRLLGID